MKIKFYQNKREKIIQLSKTTRIVLTATIISLLSFNVIKAQNVTGFGYGTYISVDTGTLNYGTISNPFTITYSGGSWVTKTSATYPPVSTPGSLSNYVQPGNMLELGAWVTLNASVPPLPVATYTFDSPLPATTVMFIQDVDALESFKIEFLDESGAVLDPSTLGTYHLSNPARSFATLTSTALTVTGIDNNNYAESLSDFVINSSLVKQVRITQIASRDDLAASGTAEFYFAAPSTPTTDPESSLNNAIGSNVTLDLLTGDLLGSGSQATPALITVNFTAPSGGTVSGNTVTVPGQGVWTYVPATGMITFDPEDGFGGDPTPLTYTITEISTGLTSNISTETITYSKLPVDLISFNCKQIDGRIVLTWKTANEVNFSHFEILKSTSNAMVFGSIGEVAGSNQNIYNYTDAQPKEGINYYKLKMVDLDGTSKLSKIISLKFEPVSNLTDSRITNVHIEGASGINFFPNPASDVLFFTGVDFKKVKSIEVISAGGTILKTRKSLSAGTIDISAISNGIYLMKVVLNDGSSSTQKIVVSK